MNAPRTRKRTAPPPRTRARTTDLTPKQAAARAKMVIHHTDKGVPLVAFADSTRPQDLICYYGMARPLLNPDAPLQPMYVCKSLRYGYYATHATFAEAMEWCRTKHT